MGKKIYKAKEDITSWEKAYWYLRILINSDRYGGLGKQDQKLKELADYILITHKKVSSNKYSLLEKQEILWNVLEQRVTTFISRKGTKKEEQIKYFLFEIRKYLTSIDDYCVFATIINEVLLPTNLAIKEVPSTEAIEFAKTYSKALLRTQKEKALPNLIREWDLLTEELCLNRERDLLVELFKKIRNSLDGDLKKDEIDVTLTAACQEFERRVGQKRKQRAGKDLESATSFILDFFEIEHHGSPQHFATNFEVDNWVKDKNGCYIGICLKRTLRERWKQSDIPIETMTKSNVKNIIHLINNDQDLSSSKIAQLGENRHIFFLADDSSVLESYKNDATLGEYLFPMSSLIENLKRLMR